MTHSFKNLIESSAQTLAENINILDSTSDNYDYEPEYKPDPPMKIQTYRPKRLPKNYNIRPIKRGRMIIKHNLEERKLYCVECKAQFPTTRLLREHCIESHPVKCDTGRDCEYCDEKFEDFRNLVIHRKLHLKPYLCKTCWVGFYNNDDYETHTCEPNQGRGNQSNEKLLRQCDQCGKSYPPGYIKVHMMTHGNDLRYSCKYCPKKFKVANGLNSHVLWNHKRTRNHKCEVCEATFISASARSTHIRKNHLKEKKYGCESCAKRFFSKSELQRHMLTHTGVKNYHCNLCDKSYQTRYGLNVHLKSHAHVQVNVLNL